MVEQLEKLADVELVDVVDERGCKVDTVPRSQAYGLLTWTSHVILFNQDGDVLITRRGEGKRFAGYWEVGITETLRSGETAKSAARRGLEEELGIPLDSQPSLIMCFQLFYRNPSEPMDKKNAAVFRCTYSGSLTIDKQEIVQAEFMPVGKLRELISTNRISATPMIAESWRMYEKAFLDGQGR